MQVEKKSSHINHLDKTQTPSRQLLTQEFNITVTDKKFRTFNLHLSSLIDFRIVIYLTKAQNWFTEFEFEGINEVFSWDDKVAGAKILLAEATGSSNDISSVRTLCQTYVDYPRSPQGRTHFMQWGSNRYASNGAFICLKVSLLFPDLLLLHKIAQNYKISKVHVF